VQLSVNGEVQSGISADHLPPKWFTKNPETSFTDDIKEMLDVINSACLLIKEIGSQASPFRLWKSLDEQQSKWGEAKGYPPLLYRFGVSLVERAIIDAFCRSVQQPFHQALNTNSLGVELGEIHPELKDQTPNAFLPKTPLQQVYIRHTVGLSDPLTENELSEDNRCNDGLPVSLERCIQVYKIKYFKIKICGDLDRDIQRLKTIVSVIHEFGPQDYVFTLDGNEQYKDLRSFKTFWEKLNEEKDLKDFLSHLIFVEQPIHRSLALTNEIKTEIQSWKQRPPMIIDESDGGLDSLRRALDCGYNGASHKNCKGVFKGISNACLIESLRRQNKGQEYILSGEDLTNIGPIALLEDLCVMSTLGISHVERNGHHYFSGLRMFSKEIQDAILRSHSDLFYRHSENYPTLNIRDGKVQLGSLHQHGLGPDFDLNLSSFIPLKEFSFQSLD
jgi:hypothetical protein